MMIIRVNGKPAPQGSKTRNRHGAIYESSAAVGPWRDAVRAETQRTVADTGAGYRQGESVELSLLFLLARPAGHYGSGRNAGNLRASAPARPATTPDFDKLTRAVCDGITQGGAIGDDKQIADCRVSKDYCVPGEVPGCLIRLELAAVVPVVERRLFNREAELLAIHDTYEEQAAALRGMRITEHIDEPALNRVAAALRGPAETLRRINEGAHR